MPDEQPHLPAGLVHEFHRADGVVDLVGKRPVTPVALGMARPRLSKRSMPMPSLASCLQIRLAAGQSLPRVNPWANTPHPRTSPCGASMMPAKVGPVVLTKLTRSATRITLGVQRRPRMQTISGNVPLRSRQRGRGDVEPH